MVSEQKSWLVRTLFEGACLWPYFLFLLWEMLFFLFLSISRSNPFIFFFKFIVEFIKLHFFFFLCFWYPAPVLILELETRFNGFWPKGAECSGVGPVGTKYWQIYEEISKMVPHTKSRVWLSEQKDPRKRNEASINCTLKVESEVVYLIGHC